MRSTNVSRRELLAAVGCAGALSVMGVGLSEQQHTALADDVQLPERTAGQGLPVEAAVDPKTGDLQVNEEVIIRYSACLGCYSSCGNRVKLSRDTGRLLSVGGNPYHPSCAYPYLPFEAPLTDAYLSMSYANGKGNLLRGTSCGRGQGTQDGYTQPDRITTPLKRAGKRGEGKWKPISWDQLIQEVTEGGKLFAEIGEDQDITGFIDLHDPNTPMDPDQPGLGPISNQLVFLGGRGDGRGGVNSRFTKSFGTINQFGHGST